MKLPPTAGEWQLTWEPRDIKWGREDERIYGVTASCRSMRGTIGIDVDLTHWEGDTEALAAYVSGILDSRFGPGEESQ